MEYVSLDRRSRLWPEIAAVRVGKSENLAVVRDKRLPNPTRLIKTQVRDPTELESPQALTQSVHSQADTGNQHLMWGRICHGVS